MHAYVIHYRKAVNLKAANVLTPSCRRGATPTTTKRLNFNDMNEPVLTLRF